MRRKPHAQERPYACPANVRASPAKRRAIFHEKATVVKPVTHPSPTWWRESLDRNQPTARLPFALLVSHYVGLGAGWGPSSTGAAIYRSSCRLVGGLRLGSTRLASQSPGLGGLAVGFQDHVHSASRVLLFGFVAKVRSHSIEIRRTLGACALVVASPAAARTPRP
jgi:hypothetical protein